MEANYHSTKRDKERIPLTAFQRQIEPQREYSPVILDETSREMPNISSAAPARDHQYQQGMDDEKATAEYEAESWLVAMWMTRMEPTLLAIQRTFEATRRGNQLRLHQEAAEHAPKASNDKAAKRTPAEDARAPLTENSIASEPRLEPDGDDDHLWQVYTFPGKSGVTLGIYLRGLGAMNQVKIDKLLYQLFHEAGESMAWPAFQVHTKMGGRHSAVKLANVVPGRIEWFRTSIYCIVQQVGADQYLHSVTDEEAEVELGGKCVTSESLLVGADSVQQAQPPYALDGKNAASKPRRGPADSVLQAQPPEQLGGRSSETESRQGPPDAELQAQPPDGLDGKSAAREPRQEPADSVQQAQPPDGLDGKSAASEQRLEAADSAVLQAQPPDARDGKSAAREPRQEAADAALQAQQIGRAHG